MDVEFKNHLSVVLNTEIHSTNSLTGGDINYAHSLETSSGKYFIKWNDTTQAGGMFDSEAQAIKQIASTGAIRTPKIVSTGKFKNKAYLLLNFIDSCENISAQHLYDFGVQLAHLHRHPADYFGFQKDNYIGTLDQHNCVSDSWSEFYIEQRMIPQISLAKKKGFLRHITKQTIDGFYQEITKLFYNLKPSLLHGDLWNGNFIIDKKGKAYLIDPASYYGHCEVDLAMSELFGNFGDRFYVGYDNTNKISDGYKERKAIYQLYYLLVHLNLFGGSYENACTRILSKFD